MIAQESELRELYHHISAEHFHDIISRVDPKDWERWQANKDEYYKQCKRLIKFKTAHYANATPISSQDIESTAALYFCIACLRWDPEGAASLPTYVANQLGYLSGYLVGKEARHKDNVTTVEVDGKQESVLELLGEVDPDNTLLQYIEMSGPDVLKLYKAIAEGYYARRTQSGSARPISAVGLYRSKVLGWDSLPRYQNALRGLQQALHAWQTGQNYKGLATISRRAL